MGNAKSFQAFLRLLAAGAATAMIAGGAHAATVFDTPLVNPPGYYNGLGNPNEGFTVNTQNGVELGLGVQYRKTGPQVHPDAGTSTYHVNTGIYTAPADFCSGVCALWNFQFSVNLRATTPNGGLTLNDVHGQFNILNVANGQTLSFAPTLFPDNAGYNGSPHAIATATDWGAQNSENLHFLGFLNPSFGFDPNMDDTYIITFMLLGPENIDLGTVSETIIAGAGAAATPLPAALPLFAGGLGVFGFLARRRKNKKAVAA